MKKLLLLALLCVTAGLSAAKHAFAAYTDKNTLVCDYKSEDNGFDADVCLNATKGKKSACANIAYFTRTLGKNVQKSIYTGGC